MITSILVHHAEPPQSVLYRSVKPLNTQHVAFGCQHVRYAHTRAVLPCHVSQAKTLKMPLQSEVTYSHGGSDNSTACDPMLGPVVASKWAGLSQVSFCMCAV